LVDSRKLIYTDLNGQTKQFYLFGDVHRSSQADQEQLTAMQSILTNRESKETDLLHILIEQPTSVVRMFNEEVPTVLMDLTQRVNGLNHTRAENTEIRCVAHAATFLFQPDFDFNPCEVFPEMVFDTAKKQCVVEKVTVADLIDEFLLYKGKIQQFKNSNVSQSIKKIIEKEISTLEQKYEKFFKVIRKLSISNDESLLTISQKMYQDEQHNARESIHLGIRDLFAHLFDLYIFKRMIKLDVSKIALIAGFLHTIFVKQMLEEAGATVLVFHTSNFGVNNVVPLEPKYLDIFTELPWYDRCTVL